MSRRENDLGLPQAPSVPPAVGDLYWRIHGRSGTPIDTLAHEFGYSEAEFREALQMLVERGALSVDGGVLEITPHVRVFRGLLEREIAAAAGLVERLNDLVAVLPSEQPPVPNEHETIGGYRSEQLHAPSAMAEWIEATSGDLLMMRRDQWRMNPFEPLERAVTEAIASGREARALYPVRALSEARDVLQARAEAGEQIRVLPDVPSRMFVLPSTHALLPQLPGYDASARLVITEPGIVYLLAQLFDRLWETAEPVPDLTVRGAPDANRRLLLQQLATGVTDEQIARTLGISLRTVRRRAADLLAELGADSRFQAGVEAARRGWL